MKLADLYNKIISKEPYNDIDIFFQIMRVLKRYH